MKIDEWETRVKEWKRVPYLHLKGGPSTGKTQWLNKFLIRTNLTLAHMPNGPFNSQLLKADVVLILPTDDKVKVRSLVKAKMLTIHAQYKARRRRVNDLLFVQDGGDESFVKGITLNFGGGGAC